MPEHSPKPFAEELVADEHGSGVPLAPQQIGFSAIEAGPTHAGKGKHLGIGAWVAIVFLALVIGSAILAPILPIPDPNNDVFPGLNRAGPSLDHLFGRRRATGATCSPGSSGAAATRWRSASSRS